MISDNIIIIIIVCNKDNIVSKSSIGNIDNKSNGNYSNEDNNNMCVVIMIVWLIKMKGIMVRLMIIMRIKIVVVIVIVRIWWIVIVMMMELLVVVIRVKSNGSRDNNMLW